VPGPRADPVRLPQAANRPQVRKANQIINAQCTLGFMRNFGGVLTPVWPFFEAFFVFFRPCVMLLFFKLRFFRVGTGGKAPF
jgi:hypothetical protein